MQKTLVNTDTVKIVRYGTDEKNAYYVLFIKDNSGYIQGYNKYHDYDSAYLDAIKFIVYGERF